MKDKLKGLVGGILIGTLITGGTVLAANKAMIEVSYEFMMGAFMFLFVLMAKTWRGGSGRLFAGERMGPLAASPSSGASDPPEAPYQARLGSY